MIIIITSDSYNIIYNSNVTSENLDINVYFTLTLLFLCNFQRTIERFNLTVFGLSKLNRVNNKTQLCLEDQWSSFTKVIPFASTP